VISCAPKDNETPSTINDNSSAVNNEIIWRDDFNSLNQWTGGEQVIAAGTLTLSSDDKSITTNTAVLSREQDKIKFRLKPAIGTPGYANLNIHFSTDEQGQVNDSTYTLELYGTESKYFKITKSGYNTLYFSGDNNGLLTGPDNWHEIEVTFTPSQLQINKNGVEVLSLDIADTDDIDSNRYLSLDANSGDWEFDWLSITSTNATGGGNDTDTGTDDNNTTTDTDNDGLPDNYEIAHGLNQNDSSDAENDNDGDGFTNLQEFTNNTDPNEANATQPDSQIEGVPIIAPIPDQRTTVGSLYQYTPVITPSESYPNDQLIWQKVYGQDSVNIDKDTGTVTWLIPDNLPNESFYIGIKATNSLGSTEETWIVTVGDTQVHYVGKSDGMLTIKDAFNNANSGDTIIITDDHYDGYPYTLDSNGGAGSFALPPSGSTNNYTTVMAQTPGKVSFSEGIYIAGKRGDNHHLAYKGMVSSQGVRITSGNEDSNRPHHIKFVLMGATNGGFRLMNSDYILVESSYALGSSRYKFISYKSNNIILRRTVSRYDLPELSGQNSPLASYSIYSSNNVAVQNAIDIDSDALDFYPHGDDIEYGGAFYVPTTAGPSANVEFQRSIAINGKMKFAGYDNTNGTAEVLFENVIGWDIEIPADEVVRNLTHGHGQAAFNHLTIGNISYQQQPSALFNGYNEHEDNFTNSLFYNLIPAADAASVYLFRDIEQLSYNNFFNVGEQDTGQIRAQYLYNTPNLPDNYSYDYDSFTYIDPMVNSLRYILRIESNTALAGIASDSGNIGATVEYMIGKSGTLYGESGWEQDNQVPMWPFPAEGLIKQKMAAFSYTGPDYLGNPNFLTGARGFAAQGNGLYGGPISLTSYIWEYLGQPCPADVCL